MTDQKKGMRPIWYFVGLMLLAIGLLIVIAGILNLFITLPSTSIVGETHPDIWWGSLIALVGILYIWKHAGVRVR